MQEKALLVLGASTINMDAGKKSHLPFIFLLRRPRHESDNAETKHQSFLLMPAMLASLIEATAWRIFVVAYYVRETLENNPNESHR